MRRRTRTVFSLVSWNLLVWILAAPAFAQAQNAEQLQIETGRRVVAQVCSTCHTTIARMVQVHKQSREQWRGTVYFMISRGAQLMPDEIEPVTAYLAAAAESSRSVETRPAAGRADQQTAETDGRAILQRTCQQCHELATASTKLASEDWTAVIARMMNYGARLTPADQQKLIGYLNGPGK